MNDAISQLAHATRAEVTRSGGRRSVLIFGALPGAVILPLLVTIAIAFVAERFANMSSSIQVVSVTTTNSVYWVITFTVMVWAVVATFAQASAERGPVGEVQRYLYPRFWTAALARWIVFGAYSALCSAILVVAVMLLLPRAFPSVYSGVVLNSTEGWRFVVTVPIFAVLAVGIGVGVAALIGHPAGSVVALLGWTYVVENAVVFIPNGFEVQTYMPFLNGIYGTGQELSLLPRWGLDAALAYVGAITLVIFLLGCGVLALRRRSR